VIHCRCRLGPVMENWMPQLNSHGGVDDFQLAQRAAGGDHRAFHLLVERHGRRLYRLAVSLIGNTADAEDVVQETFVGAFKALAKFEARSSVKTWLTGILLLQAAKWRRDRLGKQAGALEFAGDVAQAGDAQAQVDRGVDIQAALQRLGEEHRQVLLLREMQQMSYEEIAEALDVPRGTVESRLHRARAEMREKLKAYGK